MEAEWTPASYSLTLDELSAQASPHRFLYNGTIFVTILRKEELLYNGTIFVTILRKEELPGGTCYAVVARRASRPCRLPASAVVTPVTPGPPPHTL